jgi:hypothetical protein
VSPDQFFETKILKDATARAEWNTLTLHDRRAISFRFFEIALSPDFRSRIEPLADQPRPNGRRILRFALHMGFGSFVFAMPLHKDVIALVDFHVDMNLLRAERSSPAWHH